MSDIKAIVIFVVITGAFFWAIDVIEKVIRNALARRRAARLDALVRSRRRK
jgi:hypothetical protein